MLANRLTLVVALYSELNAFFPDEIDMADACPKEHIVDEGHDSDEDFDIL